MLARLALSSAPQGRAAIYVYACACGGCTSVVRCGECYGDRCVTVWAAREASGCTSLLWYLSRLRTIGQSGGGAQSHGGRLQVQDMLRGAARWPCRFGLAPAENIGMSVTSRSFMGYVLPDGGIERAEAETVAPRPFADATHLLNQTIITVTNPPRARSE